MSEPTSSGRLEPGWSEPRYKLVSLLRELRLTEEAAEEARKLLERNPADETAQQLMRELREIP